MEITEYADYQCPFCQTFATLQMPTIEERLIKTGRLRWRYRDFPLQQHQFAAAGRAFRRLRRRAGEVLGAARADLRGPGRVVRGDADASDNFREYAKRRRAGPRAYDQCMKSGKYAGRIQASYEEGAQAGVSSTPTLLVGNRLYRGRIDSDAIRPTGGLPEPTHPVSDDEESAAAQLGNA